MRQRFRYLVVPDGEKWIVREEGGLESIGEFDTKDIAVQHARELAQDQKPSQVVVERADGRIEAEHTFEDHPLPRRI
jgi:hypothetical protein